MNGRVEIDTKIFKTIEDGLSDYPEYIISWYYYLKANEVSAMSCRDYMNKTRRFLSTVNDDIGNVALDDLTVDTITKYFITIKYNNETGTETSYSYKQSVWSCLNSLFSFLYERNYTQSNYLKDSGIKRTKGKDLERINHDRVLLTKEDFHKIMQAVENGAGSNKAKGYQRQYKNRDKSIMLIFMTTGLRKTALEEINVNDIDLDNNTLTTIDKGHKVQNYYLDDYTVDIIRKWLIDRYFLLGDGNTDALFISKEKKRMCGSSITKLVDKYAKEALGYHISPHKLRSGFSSIMYEETGDAEFVRRAVGHSNIETTQRYIVTENKERREAANIMGHILKEGGTQ